MHTVVCLCLSVFIDISECVAVSPLLKTSNSVTECCSVLGSVWPVCVCFHSS